MVNKINNFWLVDIVIYNGNDRYYNYCNSISQTDQQVLKALTKIPYKFKVTKYESKNTGAITYGDVLIPNVTKQDDLIDINKAMLNLSIKYTSSVKQYLGLNDTNLITHENAVANQLVLSSIETFIPELSNLIGNINIIVKEIINSNDILSIYSDGSINNSINKCSGAIAITNRDIKSGDTVLLDTLTNELVSYNTDVHVTDAELTPNATNNIGELHGVYLALKHGMNSDKRVICITSDSQYALRSLREYIYTWRKNNYIHKTDNGNEKIKNLDLIKEICDYSIEVMSKKILVFRWVKGHEYTGVRKNKKPVTPLNIVCDEVAKSAIDIKI